MELFLTSNIIITSSVILYCRYIKSSVISKLILSKFALICWLLPLTLIRNYLPQEVAVNIQWLSPLMLVETSSLTISENVSLIEKISFLDIFLFTSLIGLFLFITQLLKHLQWLKLLEKDLSSKLFCNYQGIDVRSSEQINNALLVGYSKPTIWINPKLKDSSSLDIILHHEFVHYKHKDNYWLFLFEFSKAIYWWNPLVKILINNLKEQLESRCDYKTSLFFKEGTYLKKLTNLIINDMPVLNTGFSSAAISKNSNIRRLKYLKEKQTMNLFSKMMISLTLFISVIILTFPISSINAVANENEPQGISMIFDNIKIESISQMIGKYLDLETIVDDEIKDELVSVNLVNVPDEKILSVFTEILNVSFIQQGKQLIVTNLPGGVNQTTSIKKPTLNPALVYSSIGAKPDDIGVFLDLKTKVSTPKENAVHTLEKKFQMWSHFNKYSTIKLSDSFELDLTIKDGSNNRILIEAKVYFYNSPEEKELLSTPRLFTTNGNLATIEVGEAVPSSKNPSFRLEIRPTKATYAEIEGLKKKIPE